MIVDQTRENRGVLESRNASLWGNAKVRQETSKYAERMAKLLEALGEDVWLPMELRSHLVDEIPLLQRSLSSDGETEHMEAARRIHELAHLSFAYGPEMLDSEAIMQLRILDLELNPPQAAKLSSEGRGRYVEG